MSTDEEIGRAVREYLEAPRAGLLVAHGGRLRAGDDVVYRLQQAAKNLREDAGTDNELARHGVGPWTCIGGGVARFNEHGLAASRVYTDTGDAPDIEAAKAAADAALLRHLREVEK